MFTTLFWNLDGQPRERVCARLASRHRATVLVLAECSNPAEVLSSLNPPSEPPRFNVLGNPKRSRVEIFTTCEPSDCELVTNQTHFTIHALNPPGVGEILLCSVHMPSKLRTDDRAQDVRLAKLGETIQAAERDRGHSRTLLIGDLNAHPFQYGVYAANGLHAVASRRVASLGRRTVDGTEYPFFYNPMWRFLGDASDRPPGSYFRWKSEHDCLFWYVFDQALLRPDLLPYFRDENLAILTEEGETSFATAEGRPDRDVASDHFPILIALDFSGSGHEQHNS